MNIIANLPSGSISNGKNHGGDKEMTDVFSVVGNVNGKLHEIVTARCWMGRAKTASVIYATVWVHGNEVHLSGTGSAGGGGYHKVSAAIGMAITSAGIVLADAEKRVYIDGVGNSAVEAALVAIARAVAGEQEYLFISH
jgi:hypothetical protein